MTTNHDGIRLRDVAKSYGSAHVLHGVTFDCPPGTVTGLLGPNGSGKSTAMRTMIDLTRADAGTVTYGRTPYRDLALPGRSVGSVLDPGAHHPGRSVHETLMIAAIMTDAPRSRVNDLIAMLGLSSVARRRFGALSLGMKQRVALGLALIGNPRYLILDEPMNGLDIETGAWLRDTLVRHAHTAGGVVLVSTHLLNELQLFADRLVVLSQGTIAYSGPVRPPQTRVRTVVTPADVDLFRRALDRRGIAHTPDATGRGLVVEAAPRAVSEISVSDAILIDELTAVTESIADLYRSLTQGDYRTEGTVLDHG